MDDTCPTDYVGWASELSTLLRALLLTSPAAASTDPGLRVIAERSLGRFDAWEADWLDRATSQEGQ